MFFNELPSNTSAQTPLLIVGFGFTPAQSALFNVAKPLWGLVLLFVSAAMLYSTRLGTGYTCAISYIPCIIGGIIMVSIVSPVRGPAPNVFCSFPRPGQTKSL